MFPRVICMLLFLSIHDGQILQDKKLSMEIQFRQNKQTTHTQCECKISRQRRKRTRRESEIERTDVGRAHWITALRFLFVFPLCVCQLREMDWQVQSLYNSLEAEGLLDSTLLVYSSDNGPWEEMCEYGGSPGPFKGEWQRSATGGGGGSTSKLTTSAHTHKWAYTDYTHDTQSKHRQMHSGGSQLHDRCRFQWRF